MSTDKVMQKIMPPTVVVVGGMDPSGGAGLCADIQTLSAMGCHAAPVATAITVQDTATVKKYQLLETDLVRQQLQVVLDDLSPTVIKTGMLGTGEVIAMLADVLRQYPALKLVVDPVMRSNYNKSLSEDSLVSAMKALLLPIATLITPNLPEAEILSGTQKDADQCAARLADVDCFITGTHADSGPVINRYYQRGRKQREWKWERLPFDYHGSGCTLASAIAAGMARGMAMEQALQQAQQFVMESLQTGFKPGHGQYLPNRLSAVKNY